MLFILSLCIVAEFRFSPLSITVPEDTGTTLFTVLFMNGVTLADGLVINAIVDVGVAGSTAVNSITNGGKLV